MRVLIAFEGSHRSYGEALGHALRGLRPGAAVSVVRTEDLGAEVSHFDPHVVVCDPPQRRRPAACVPSRARSPPWRSWPPPLP